MIAGLFWMIVANAASLLGAYALLRPLQTPSASTNLVIFLLLRLALISLAVLFTGLAGVMTSWGPGLPAAAALAALAAQGVYPKAWTLRWPPLGPWWALFTGLVAARLLLQVWFLAPHVGDVLSYHLPKVAEWTRSGAITRVVGVDWRSWFPAGFALVEI